MKVSAVQKSKIVFGRAFTTAEREQADRAKKEALKLLDCDKIIAIIPEASFPSEAGKDIGIGQLNSKSNNKFYDFLKTYTGANSVKVLPLGEYTKSARNFYCNYRTSALTLGTYSINPEELASDEMGNILSQKTLQSLYEDSSTKAHFENTVGRKSKLDDALKEAYNNFLSSAKLNKEKELFANYKKENYDFIERRAIFEVLTDEYGDTDVSRWRDVDRNLFNPDIVSQEVRDARINELKSKYSQEIDFTFFKQYLADKHLANARKQMNEKGITLTGDCLIAFSTDEIWAYPKAFADVSVASKEWGLKSLNYADLLKEGSEANWLFRKKAENFAKRYDNIRVDVGWAYINPTFYPMYKNQVLPDNIYCYDHSANAYRLREPLGDRVLRIFEDAVKSVKGKDYRQENIFYEILAGINDFSPYKDEMTDIIPELKGRTIVQSTFYMNPRYATIEQLENTSKIPRKNYIIMAGNHDNLALQFFAHRIDKDSVLAQFGNNVDVIFENQLKPLGEKFDIKESVFRDSPEEFVKAKFAYNFLGRNIKMFFMDIFGRKGQFDSHENNNTWNYRDRLTPEYEKEFHQAVQEKRGLNIMDAISKAMKAKGLDKTNSDIYNEIIKYRDILYEKGALCEEEANKFVRKSTSKNKIWMPISAAALLLLTAGIILWKKAEGAAKQKSFTG